MEFGVYSAADSASFVNFITSNVFEKDTFKLIITKAAEKDIITAHKDVYCGDDNEPIFTITCREIIHDKNLFETYLAKVPCQCSKGFFTENEKHTVLDIIRTVNTLFSLVRKDSKEISESIRTDDLVVTEDVASFDFEDIAGTDENAYNVSPICVGEEGTGPQFVPLTRVLELRHNNDARGSQNLFSDSVLLQPFYNEFIVFNKGYGYIADIFREVFPEFQVIVHTRFPKLELAEQMLWYQVNKLVCNDRREVSSVVIEKIRTFFDCSSRKRKECFPALTDEIPFSDDFPVIHDLRGPLQQYFAAPPMRIPIATGIFTAMTQRKTGPEIEFAQAFTVDRSPVKDAFDPAGWGKDTRKETADINLNVEKRLIIKEFTESQCHRIPGTKVKSSKLFQMFKDYYTSSKRPIDFDLAFNQTSFSTIMKQVSTFETRREKDGIYWTDLHVGEVTKELQEQLARKRLQASLPFNQNTRVPEVKKVQPLLDL